MMPVGAAVFGEVGQDEAAIGAEGLQLGDDCLAAFLLAVAENEGGGAGLCQIERDLPANALGRSSDQDGLALHEMPPFSALDQGGAPRIAAV